MRRIVPILLLILVAPMTTPPSFTEVVDSSASGFTSRNVAVVEAHPLQVYALLTDSVGSWWSSDHTFSGSSENLSIDASAGGCFCERLPNGGTVEHLTVVHAHPGRLLRLRGALGPLQSTAVTGAMSWELEPAEGGTSIVLTYTVGGYVPGGLDGWAAAVDRVVGEQLERLAGFATTGSPDVPPTTDDGEPEPGNS